ncbi:MAG: hypothetical protein KGL39_46305 [Patescibacteria group bacterium]|nr:hypothetical protein [Patescibacteria group bacterium]
MRRIANKTKAGLIVGKTASPIQSSKKTISVAGHPFRVDHESLIRMIRQVTQTIGEYREQDTPYAAYIVNALRKARADMASDLEHFFGVHWRIDEGTGKLVFYV